MSESLDIHGYKCISRTSSTDVLELFRSDPDAYDLVITDQAMPNLLGSDMIALMREVKPDQVAMLTTGYSETLDRINVEKQGIDLYRNLSIHMIY